MPISAVGFFIQDEGAGALFEGDVDVVRDPYPRGALLSAPPPFPTLRIVFLGRGGGAESREGAP